MPQITVNLDEDVKWLLDKYIDKNPNENIDKIINGLLMVFLIKQNF